MALIMNSVFMDVVVFLLAMYGAIYVYLVRNFNVWMKKGVPFLKPITGFGNFKSVIVGNDSIGSFLKNIYDEATNKPYVGVFILDRPVLVIRDVDLIKAILVKDFHYFADRDFKPDIRTDPLSARSLVGLTGPKWRYMRTTLTPTFTSGKMKKMFHLVNECGQQLVTYLDSHRELEDDDFVAQAFTFLTAGFETSSTTLSFALYELSLQPDIQKRLRDDIQSVLAEGDGTVSYEALQRMVYLDQVVSETLRKYPVLPFLDRRALEPYRLPGDEDIILEKDQTILIPVLGLHWDPEFFPKPEQFDPERFSVENKRIRPHYSYLPFGEGPRNCIGMRMGLMQTKVGLVHILTHFEVSPCENTPIPLELDPKSFLLSAIGDLPLNFQPLR